MNGDLKTKSMLEKYMSDEIDKYSLIDATQKLFHENLKHNRYDLDFIKEYYIMTEILDLRDCSKPECEKNIRHCLDIYNGKESVELTISILLDKEQLTSEALKVIGLIERLKAKSELSVQECKDIQHFIGKQDSGYHTLYDPVLAQLRNLLKWGFFSEDDAVYYEPKSMLYIADDSKLRKALFARMDSTVDVLLGISPVWVTCKYDDGNCRLQVIT